MTNLIKQFENKLIHSDPWDLMFRNFFDADSFFEPVLTSHLINYPVDIIETENGVKFEIATPGLSEDDVKIEILNGDTLNVSYNKEAKEENETEKFIHKGIAKRSFNMGWKIGGKYNLNEVEASMNNGLLTIEVPVSPETKPKKISISAGDKKTLKK